MPGVAGAFFGLEVVVELVREGKDGRLPRVTLVLDDGSRVSRLGHTLGAVYCEMLVQICSDFPGLPDVRTLTLGEIRFFYDALRPTLKRHSAPK